MLGRGAGYGIGFLLYLRANVEFALQGKKASEVCPKALGVLVR